MTRRARRVFWAVGTLSAALGVGCGRHGSGSGPGGSGDPKAADEPLERPKGPLSLEDAQKYALGLVNRDRAAEGLEPVEWDETAARAGRRHAEDMAKHGFTAHWGTDGSVPEQRYTEAGGTQFVQENAGCFFDGQSRELDPDPKFDPALIEKIQSAFINETPPNDGHRKNILKPVHNKVGIGLAKAAGVNQPCMSQEFLDEYGEYDDVPKTARIKQMIEVSGEVKAPVKFGGVGVGRIDLPEPLPPEHLNSTSIYRIPQPHILYFPEGFKTPKPVKLDGSKFEIEVPLDDRGKKGRYEISVWGNYPGSGKELVMISLRTVLVK
jgi:uncharacterized protein YkwD